MLQIPEGLFPVSMTKPVTTNGAIAATDAVSLKNAVMAWIVVHLTQAVGDATKFSPYRTTAVGSAGAVLANVVPIWYGNVSTSSNALTRQTDAIDFTIDVGVTGEAYIIFQIDPANLGGSYDCVGLVVADSSQATNFVEATLWVQPKYATQTADQLDFLTD